MSKLFKLKEYYSIEEAAKYLTSVFEEDVTAADIYRLGLDSHIKLSIDFVNHIKARKGKIIPNTEAKFPPSITKDWVIDGLGVINGKPITAEILLAFAGIKIDDEHQLIFEEGIHTVNGVWDLCMLANERLDIEHKYQWLVNGIDLDLVDMNGTYVEKYINGELVILELLVRFTNEELETIHGNDLPEYFHHSNYYPSSALPHDCPLVVKSSELSKLINTVMEDPAALEQPAIKQKTARTPESSIFDSLGIMAYMLSENVTGLKWGQNPNASKIVKAIEQKAASLGIELTQITNLARDISEALEKLAPELNNK